MSMTRFTRPSGRAKTR